MQSRTLLACALLVIAPAARSDGPAPLRYDLVVDGAITAGATGAWIISEALMGTLAPTACHWCASNGFDAGARDLLLSPWPASAATASDAIAFGMIPVGVLAHQLLAARAAGDLRAGWADLLVIAQATALAMDLDQVAKFAAGRQRPFVHYGNFRDPARRPQPDDNLSFFSGHATLSFALATSAGTVSMIRRYPSTPWVWGIGMTAATAASLLRISADKHYLSDVLAGAVVGGGLGFAVPWFFHRPREGEGKAGSQTEVMFVPNAVVVIF
jgi:membrane-associated phospholipid phosphatase